MLKKLQELLFEEEDDSEDEEEIVEEPVAYTQPIAQVKAEEPAPAPVAAPAPEPAVQTPVFKAEETEVRPAMQRIDVTQPLPTVSAARPQTSRNESVFREPEAPKVQSTGLGITFDDEPVRTPKPAPKPVSRPARREEKSSRSSSYQFQPVISPIFGVDEKDMNALKTTTTKISEAKRARSDMNVSPIISPMYGTNQEDKPSSIQKTVEKSNEQERIMATPAAIAAEDEIPEFSLDDILKVRDEEVSAQNATASGNTESLFPDLNLWDDEPESAEDATIVIERQRNY